MLLLITQILYWKVTLFQTCFLRNRTMHYIFTCLKRAPLQWRSYKADRGHSVYLRSERPCPIIILTFSDAVDTKNFLEIHCPLSSVFELQGGKGLHHLQMEMLGLSSPFPCSVYPTHAESYTGDTSGTNGLVLRDWPTQEWPEPFFNELHRNITGLESYFRKSFSSIITTVRLHLPWIKISSMDSSQHYKLPEMASSSMHAGSRLMKNSI